MLNTLDILEISDQLLGMLGTFASVFIAYLGLYALAGYRREQRRAKGRYTLDLLERLNIMAVHQYSSFNVVKEVLDNYAKVELNEHLSDNAASFLSRLNNFELISVAVRKDLIDPDIVWEIAGQSLVLTFHSAKELIEKAREYSGNPLAFSDLEALARLWGDRGLSR